MNPQIRDKFYDEFLKEPTKDNFRDFIFKNCGELDEVDFKETWIDKGHLAKTMLAMANSMGGGIIIGIKDRLFYCFSPIPSNPVNSSGRLLNYSRYFHLCQGGI